MIGLFSRISAEVWNDLAPRWAANERDRLADECVRQHLRPMADSLRFVLHVPSPTGLDPYEHFGTVGWQVRVR